MEEFVSERAKVSRNWQDDTSEEISTLCNNDPFHKSKNSFGYINLRSDINNFCKEAVWPKLKNEFICNFDSLKYKNYEIGSINLRCKIAKFMTEFLESYEPVCHENLFCSNGVTSCLDFLCHCIADPGDVFLIPTPMYGHIYKNCMQRSLVELFPIPLINTDDEYENANLTIEKVVCAYEMAMRADCTVRAIILVNPNNPLGEIYSPELLMDIISFCSEKSLHVIVDEIFALSEFSMNGRFHSILKFPQLPDTDRIHVLYGLSKDFGIPGLRIGVIHTKCKQLHKSLRNLSCFQTIPYPVMEIAANFLEDLYWCRDYVSKYQERLSSNYEYCVTFLTEIGVKVRKCEAGYFLWLDLRYLCGSSFEGEEKFFMYLLKNTKLYLGRGEEFFCAEPGWFRITFARYRNHLTEGLKRLQAALTTYKP